MNIKITKRVANIIKEKSRIYCSLGSSYAKVLALGKGKDKRIVDYIGEINYEEKCEEMPLIKSETLIKEYFKLLKKGILIVGLVKFGAFIKEHTRSYEGKGLRQLAIMNPDFFMLYYTPKLGIRGESYNPRTKRYLKHKVIING